ncbi:hypothetical protein LENED_009979 [Lentinula edodes]|uniref:MYND-type domain-containing protein n=1 Tax=Lentinula edodes TaxID=5353 RepID=A0A1Q3EL89_LENED|nr:hypothetical protein LENED_009979 [Lentinula edodes]
MLVRLPSLRNTVFFPTLLGLPHDYYFTNLERQYYTVSKDLSDDVGVRLEEPKSIRILPVGLEELITASELYRAPCSGPISCAFCGGGASKRCSRCSTVFYCSQICQVRAWKAKHKNECMVIQQMKKWSEFNWDQYDAYRGFTDFDSDH